MPYFITQQTGIINPGPNVTQAQKDAFVIPASKQSLLTSVLSAGTFFGALMAGDVADFFGRRVTIIVGCVVFAIGCVLQTASTSLGLVSSPPLHQIAAMLAT